MAFEALKSIDCFSRVPNSKCVSELGHYKCNSSSLLNHRLIYVTFFYFSDLRSVWFYNGQTWTTYKEKVPYGDRSNGLMHPRGLSSFLRYHNCSNVFFCSINICLKETNFKRESEQNILHRRLAFTIAQYWFTLGVRYGCLSIFSQVLIFFLSFLVTQIVELTWALSF